MLDRSSQIGEWNDASWVGPEQQPASVWYEQMVAVQGTQRGEGDDEDRKAKKNKQRQI